MYKDLDISLLPGIITKQEAFTIFWESGMRKVNKMAAHKVFMRIIEKETDIKEFALTLDQDIKWRLSNEQFGFSAMHPTTYLNGERWEDEQIPKGGRTAYEESKVFAEDKSTLDMTLEEQMSREWAK